MASLVYERENCLVARSNMIYIYQRFPYCNPPFCLDGLHDEARKKKINSSSTDDFVATERKVS